VALLESLTGAAPSVGFVHGMLARAAGLLGEVDKRIRTLITLRHSLNPRCLQNGPLGRLVAQTRMTRGLPTIRRRRAP